jgi:hypothetical protein
VRFSGKKGDEVAVTFPTWAAGGEDFYDFDKNDHGRSSAVGPSLTATGPFDR